MLYRFTQFALVLSLAFAIQERDKSSTQTVVAEVTRSSEPPVWATLVGSTESNKYHRPNCSIAKKIRRENAIWFTDAVDATENGYVPAGCKGRDCQPPMPPAQLPLGELGGAVMPPPDPNPPAIVTNVSGSPVATKPKSPPSRAKPKSTGPAQVRTPPPRMPPARDLAANQVWDGITPDRELEARRRWDVWAEWALDRWCDRWHVSASGRINSDSAYTQTSEQLLLGKLKAMKEQIEDNKKRMRELKAMLEGKKKVMDK
jgi:hypothetical protein